MMAGVSTFSFPGRFSSLPEIAAIIHKKSIQAGLDEDSVYAVESAVDEACSNIIEHAYEGENKGEIEMKVSLIQDGIKITLMDHGHPFLPGQVSEPKVDAPLSRRKTSGLGIFLMKKCMDSVDFQFSPGCNTLTMTKLKNSNC
jgi:serine/threonine-protein kinase RsbW